MQKLKPKILYALLCLLLGSNLKAQEKKIISLEEAVSLAVTHSKQLKSDSLNLQLVSSKIIQSQNNKNPQVSLNLSYVRISDNITPFRVNFGGGDVALNPQILNQSYNSLQVRQLLWAGGKVKDGIQMLDYDRQALYFDLDKNKKDVSYGITNIWYNLFTIKESKKVVEANILLLQNQRKDAQNFVNQGVILQNDVLKIDLAITNLQSSLIDMTTTEQMLKYNLCLLTGLNTKENIQVSETLPLIEEGMVNIDDLVNRAIANRPELKALNIRQKQADLGLKLTRGNIMPTLSAGGRLNYAMPNQRVFPNQASITGTWDVGVFLSWNLSDLFTNKEKIKENFISISKLNNAYEQAKEGIMMEINAEYSQYLQAKQQIVNANKAIEQATENFRVEQNKYGSNTTTATDFLNANTLLTQAKINLATAIANAELAHRKLLKSIK